MKKVINIVQVGLGPLGQKIVRYIAERPDIEVIAAVDINPSMVGKDIGELCSSQPSGVRIFPSIKEVENLSSIDVAILTTSSDIRSIAGQVAELVRVGLPVVSTCEELTFPWKTAPEIAGQIDQYARQSGVGVVSTGVNPGFLMDTLPSVLTGVCKEVNKVTVHRFQDARTRRIPFQKKIGAGLSLEDFDKKKASGTLRHVGLTESMHFIGHCLGWEIDKTEDIIEPVVADNDIETDAMKIPSGYAMGVRQTGRAWVGGSEKIKMVFEAAVGSGESYDEVLIDGIPDIHSRIEGGVNGDIATCSMVLNTIPRLLKSGSGLKTMADLPIVSGPGK